MFVQNQVQLLHFQKARIFSEYAHAKSKRFKELNLSTDEKKKLLSYYKMDVSSLSECNLVEFQELHCKQQLFVAINSGSFVACLNFSTDIHQKVRDWLKYHGYSLCPFKPIDDDVCLETSKNSTPESTTDFKLLW